MSEKNIFLTGSNGQLGIAISKKLAFNGCKVYGMDISSKSNNKYLDGYLQGSVIDRQDFVSFFNLLGKNMNNINVSLINNAGVSVFSPSEERTLEEFRYVTEVNLLGPIFGMTEFFSFVKLISHKNDNFMNYFSIINIASIYGMVSPNMSIYSDTKRNNSEIYGASKAGLIQMTKYFATRYAHVPINVNSISPGGVINKLVQGEEFISNYSSLVPMKRLCNEEEIGDAVNMLINSANKYLTGQNIAIDGGLTSW